MLGTIAAIGAAAAVPAAACPVSSRAAWDAAHADYLRKDALHRACRQFGHGTDAYRNLETVRHEHTGRSDSRGMANLSGPAAAAVRAALDRLNDLADSEGLAYADPAEDAAIVLVSLPAPDINAVEVKIAVIVEHGLDNHRDMPAHPFDIIEADVRRLARQEAR
jgi:hypothetical protein